MTQISKARGKEVKHNRRLIWALTFLCVALLAALPMRPNARFVTGQSSTQSAGPVHVTILYLSDVHQLAVVDEGRRGSLARVSTVLKRIREQSPNTLLLLGGNTISSTGEFSGYQGEPMIEAWNLIGLNIAVVGNNEFDFGLRVLQERVSESRFQWLGTNVLLGNKIVEGLSGVRIIDFGGPKLAFFGLLGSKPSLKSPGLTIRAPAEAARDGIDLARKSGARAFIAITNMSIDEDKELARSIPELTLIVGGRSSSTTKMLSGRTPIFKVAPEARDLGRLELTIDRLSGEVQSVDSDTIPITSEIPADPQFEIIFSKYKRATPVGPPIPPREAPTPTVCTISGRVVDDSSVYGTRINLFRPGDRKPWISASVKNGLYAITNVPEGRYELRGTMSSPMTQPTPRGAVGLKVFPLDNQVVTCEKGQPVRVNFKIVSSEG